LVQIFVNKDFDSEKFLVLGLLSAGFLNFVMYLAAASIIWFRTFIENGASFNVNLK
jgi:hypothetical protein